MSLRDINETIKYLRIDNTLLFCKKKYYQHQMLDSYENISCDSCVIRS